MSILSTCIRELLSGKKVVFFGTGQFSGTEIEILSDRISYFCDNNPNRTGYTFYGRPILGVDSLRKEPTDNTVVIINTEFFEEVAYQLLNIGIVNIYSRMYCDGNEKIRINAIKQSDNFLVRKYNALSMYNIDDCSKLFSDDNSSELFLRIIEKYRKGCFDFSDLISEQPIYFNNHFRTALTQHEVYADCGVYNGRTLLDFIFYVNGKYEQIYAFEPDVVNHSVIRRNFADVQNIQLCNNAVSNTNGKVGFDNRGTQSSHIINDDQSFVGEKIQAVRLDDACASTPTLIKMDIEGGEYNALLGARNIIEQSKPKLAISIYHCEDDLCRLPLLIQSMRTDYKFYILHHSPSYTDTVLYAL